MSKKRQDNTYIDTLIDTLIDTYIDTLIDTLIQMRVDVFISITRQVFYIFLIYGFFHGLTLVFSADESDRSSPTNYVQDHTKSTFIAEGKNITNASISRRLGICNENLVVNPIGNNIIDPLDQWTGIRSTLTRENDGFLPGSKSIRITNRLDMNSGPSQSFTEEHLDCFVEGRSMTFSMRIKLEDANGDGFVCDTATWNVSSTCPLLSFWVQPPIGNTFWFNSWNQANLASKLVTQTFLILFSILF